MVDLSLWIMICESLPRHQCLQNTLVDVIRVFKGVFTVLVTDKQDFFIINRRYCVENRLVISVALENSRGERAMDFKVQTFSTSLFHVMYTLLSLSVCLSWKTEDSYTHTHTHTLQYSRKYGRRQAAHILTHHHHKLWVLVFYWQLGVGGTRLLDRNLTDPPRRDGSDYL